MDTFYILILFQIKHLLADFAFQSSYMVMGKGLKGCAFIKPLASHCLVHVVLSAPIIYLFLGSNFMWLLGLEFIIHFIIDRLKSGPRYGGRFSMGQSPKMFWFLFGVDQLLHQLTYILFVFLWFNPEFLEFRDLLN